MDYRKDISFKRWLRLITAPLVWVPLPFMLVLDLTCVIYEYVCFPIYGIELVKRKEYILVMDRAKLDYLNGLEKLACMYCGYGNGVLRYLKEIASRTEKYWCGIMHESTPGFRIQEDQVRQKFARYGDEKDLLRKYHPNRNK
jgi:hypothetical protein